MLRRTHWPLLAIFLLTGPGRASAADPQAKPLATRFRRPIALATVDNGRQFLVANRDSGTISRVDIPARRVLDETHVGKRLADLALVPGGDHVLVADAGGRQLILCRLGNGPPQPSIRIDLPVEPTRLAIDRDGRRVAVTSKWARRLVLVDLPITPSSKPRLLPLPVPGRHLLWLPGTDSVVVADAFGGQLAVVDAAATRVQFVHRLSGHNIGGLALSPDGRRLIISHQVLNSAARTTNNDVFWGLLMTNNLRRIPTKELLSNDPLPVRRQSVVMLGQAGHAAGDPSGLSIRPDGSFVVALSGVHQVGIGHPGRFELTRISTGRRPTALWLAPDARRAVVTSTLDDRLDLIDLEHARPLAGISLGPQPEQTSFERGERLFFDAGLSRDGWMSCHSCHIDGHTNGLLADTLGDGHYGNAKRVLSLLGTLDTGPWAWDGRMGTLRDQTVHSVTTTMRGTRPTPAQLNDLVTYISGLERPAPGRAAGSPGQRLSIARGRRLFDTLDCRRCHTPPLYTSPDTYDVGLGGPKANPPSLRGVSQRRRLFHDNRAKSIEEVLERFEHQLPRKITDGERRDLVRFLESL